METRKKIRAIVADDSFFMRKVITQLLSSDPAIEVVAAAKNGQEAVDLVKQHQPDVVTMDIEMPLLNGIEALKIIMDEAAVPVIMISSLTTDGAHHTMEALSLGAVDFIAKRQGFGADGAESMKDELLEKVHSVTKSFSIRRRMERLRRSKTGTPHQEVSHTAPAVKAPTPFLKTSRPMPSFFKIIVIGISTGGPMALNQLIPKLPSNLPVSVLIVQHMPPYFTKSLSERLNGSSQITVQEAADGMLLRPGNVYIAPGGLQMLIDPSQKIRISSEKYDTLYKPSVDVTVHSVVQQFGGRALGVIMTGMGRDGASSLKELVKAGGYVLAQNEESCVVYGMPRAVVDDGTAHEIHPLENMAEAISSCLGCHAV